MTGLRLARSRLLAAVSASATRWPEMAQNLARVVGFPGFAGSLGCVLLVEADEQIDQLAAYGPGPEHIRQFGQIDEPLGVPGGPVVVGPLDDPEDTVVRLAASCSKALICSSLACPSSGPPA